MVFARAAPAAAASRASASGLALSGIRIPGESFTALPAILGVLLVLFGARESDGVRARGN